MNPPRSQQEGGDTRDRLIAAATEEFATCGYDGASLRRICAEAGVTTGSLYYLFRNKEELFRVVVSPVMDPVLEAFEELDGLGSAELAALAGDDDGALEADGLDAGRGKREDVEGLLRAIYDQRAIVLIMISNLNTSVIKDFVEKAVASTCSSMRRFLVEEGAALSEWGLSVTDWASRLIVSAMLHVFEGDETFEEADHHIRIILRFVRGGLNDVVKQEMQGA